MIVLSENKIVNNLENTKIVINEISDNCFNILVMNSLNRSEIARKIVKHYGIMLTPKQEQYVIAYPCSPDVFPVMLGDDRGIVYYQCEVPITKEGDLILVGHRYTTRFEDNVLVKSMELKRYLHDFKWNITVIDSFGDEVPMIVWEFITICF